MERLVAEGCLKPAGMNKGSNKWTDSSIRGDLHMWLPSSMGSSSSSSSSSEQQPFWDSCPALHGLVAKLRGLQEELNETCSFDSHQVQIQLTCYPGLLLEREQREREREQRGDANVSVNMREREQYRQRRKVCEALGCL